jgi:SAM-dependent methyltransferase
MLDQARAKQRVHGADRMEIVQGDLNDLPGALRGREFEAVLCFHNVLGFVEDPARTVAGLGDLLTAGGLAALVLPNTYHMAHFSIRRGQVAALADQVRSARGRFTDEMPDIHTFAPDLVEEMLTSVGLGVRHMAGFPCAIYPGYAETQAHGSSDEVVDLLADPPTRAEILASEWDLMQRRDAAGRGNNLLAVAARSVAAEQAEVI